MSDCLCILGSMSVDNGLYIIRCYIYDCTLFEYVGQKSDLIPQTLVHRFYKILIQLSVKIMTQCLGDQIIST